MAAGRLGGIMGKKKRKNVIRIVLLAESLILIVLLVMLWFPKEDSSEGAVSPGTEFAENVNQGIKPETEDTNNESSGVADTKPADDNEIDKDVQQNAEDIAEPEKTDESGVEQEEGKNGESEEEREVIAQQNEVEKVKEKADRLAMMYDYDAAIQLVQSYEGYEKETILTEAVVTYEEQKADCVPWADNTKISHCFFHSLIADTSLALGPNSGTRDGYNRYMTTIEEFEKILQQMYDRGYVLVGIHDISETVVQEDGTEKMVMKKILLPEGKIPFVMSQDDVNYYDYMDGEGFATKIVIGEDGKPTCEYIQKDGTVVTGDYDLVPVLDRFVEAHPDFSYRGAKAILAITGYEGTLGYETAAYRYDEAKHLVGLSADEKKARLESEKAACREVVAALKEDGYEFASHSYGHGNMQTNSVEKFKYDMNRWMDEVGSLLGETDVFIYPFGADICDWRGYQGEKYEYAIANGFRYFCNVDSAQYWVQMKNDYLRQGRINFDGERMMKDPDKLSCFFDVESVLDPTRPPLEE